MNAYKSEPIREKYEICWQEEYVLGMVSHAKKILVMDLLTSLKHIMSQATAHKYLKSLIHKKYLQHITELDLRKKYVVIGEVGKKIIFELDKK